MLSTIPSLAGGVIVAAIGYRLSRLLPRPLLDRRFSLPSKTEPMKGARP